MTTRELLEMTVLDSLGLLDDREQEAFERAFTEAPASVREQVRFEQTRLADMTGLLPDVEPRADLREQVLDAVRKAMNEREAARPPVRHDAGRGVPKVARGPRVSWVWRSSAIALAVIVAALGIAITQIQMDYNTLEGQLRDAQLHDKIGAVYVPDLMFETSTTLTRFEAVAVDTHARAAIAFNPDWKVARFYHENLGAEDPGEFRLVTLDENDQVVHKLADFNSNGSWGSTDIDAQFVQGARFGVIRVDGENAGQLILRAEFGTT